MSQILALEFSVFASSIFPSPGNVRQGFLKRKSKKMGVMVTSVGCEITIFLHNLLKAYWLYLSIHKNLPWETTGETE